MNTIDQLCAEVCKANRALVTHGLVTLTWGNVSGIAADRTVVAIKPSGVAYDRLTPDLIALVDLDGQPVRSGPKPSTDTLTHLELYKAFPTIGGIVHTHSPYATMFAQARMELPCLGTTHADHFAGPVPVSRQLTQEELGEYERNTGRVIVERLRLIDPVAVPAVLVAGHAPFVWGPSVSAALENAVALEAVARMAHGTIALAGSPRTLEQRILEKHHERKHGAARYYGQP